MVIWNPFAKTVVRSQLFTSNRLGTAHISAPVYEPRAPAIANCIARTLDFVSVRKRNRTISLTGLARILHAHPLCSNASTPSPVGYTIPTYTHTYIYYRKPGPTGQSSTCIHSTTYSNIYRAMRIKYSQIRNILQTPKISDHSEMQW
ncbi:uncharacterized protein LOC112692383 isoform X2 [Sipha flava]|uniref:Uncharacterized protein LOC112692383 isoform X2 n=1 Tax=Sipha flava TaxID=143950 RepID=A0A8B8GIT0_9HEMI|nr:uncharacterized protein LOC112692383 isoform X2 [Sipha flava]